MDFITTMAFILLLVMGVGAGLFYFGGLWWTVKQLPASRHPGLLVLGSFLVRSGLSIAMLYWVTEGRWKEVVVGLGGFLLVRCVMCRRLGVRPAEGF